MAMPTTSPLKQIHAAQRKWAESTGLAFDERGYVEHYGRNLAKALNATAVLSFEAGSGNELTDTAARPAKMRALHSSSALAANVFDHWLDRPDLILRWLDVAGQGKGASFEGKLATGLPGVPPNLDLLITRADGSLVGVESKFTEWLVPARGRASPFKEKYFPSDRYLWAELGLPLCQEAAERIQSGQLRFHFLNAPQLLKHALGLASTKCDFELVYLYYDAPSSEGEQHANEAAAFAVTVAEDFPLHVRTYQQVFANIASQATAQETEYVSYLRARYFPEVRR
ncbi:MAG TPA: hypothetical protein VHA82_10205 [Ramlibacter sp.]|uniref:PGN_0703 family putative restriction endonuclease n=1 Tax=Ramlibacter sp. TaxID=1917967 RepID=UPI002CC5E15C|nr:hypothetical protein [Ramlibacter sp.]HVZ44168.1 hypothetical protein [Ramlibacter sp.]